LPAEASTSALLPAGKAQLSTARNSVAIRGFKEEASFSQKADEFDILSSITKLPYPGRRWMKPTQKQVLLLDDNADQLTIRELVLRKAMVECHVATSAAAALALLRSAPGQEKVGAVITDHFMPGMNGVDFVRQLRSFNPDIPVIVISGLPDAEEEYKGLNVLFRVKPCEPEELIAIVRSALDSYPYKASA
jgi:CheY-like chemotaxis protein